MQTITKLQREIRDNADNNATERVKRMQTRSMLQRKRAEIMQTRSLLQVERERESVEIIQTRSILQR